MTDGLWRCEFGYQMRDVRVEERDAENECISVHAGRMQGVRDKVEHETLVFEFIVRSEH